MGPLEFINDRAIFFGSVLTYHVWKETVGQDHWKIILSRFEDFHLITVGTLTMGLLVYIIVSALFAVVDLVMAPKGVIPGERLQPKKAHTWEQYKKAIPLVLFNFFVMALPAVLSIYYFLHPASPRNAPSPSGMYPSLPSTLVLLRDILFSMVLREMIFYYLHRLFHHPFLYATFHKKHHEFTAPIAVSGNSYLTY
ncbi:Fatty acid hydroxylase domain-containing protein 2 [Entomophthora muscae]|uniref:Fatty acid hydroxylase domain-containing protein 2 n=1 Tax=Entomophthora muscae TaxID=34485 RepID=A0ACC2RNX1_9FUNG|nr:Fatty acid hydroxylase domain-containing protein 2 [Entomophthora muscae]